MTAKTLRNLTLHEQGEREIALASRSGYVLTREPEGVIVDTGEKGLLQAARTLGAKLRQCHERGESVLIGGHTGLWVSAILELAIRGEPIPDLYCFDTHRVRDDNGRFVFVSDGLVKVRSSSSDAGSE